MEWNALPAPPEKITLAQALVPATTEAGWSRAALEAASLSTLHDARRWRDIFPDGAAEAIWFISEVSDASMAATFQATAAPDLATVVETRLSQNSELKPFVRRVMLFDIAHPWQALRRMQRTARVMMACTGSQAPAGVLRLTALNLAYTLIVFVWLFDTSPGGEQTRAFSRRAMTLVRP